VLYKKPPNAHGPVCKTVEELFSANSVHGSSKRHHLEALGPSSIFKHHRVISTTAAGQDRVYMAFKGDDVANVLTVILQGDDIYIGIPTALVAPPRNADQFCVKVLTLT
jgi:hypothetical protein